MTFSVLKASIHSQLVQILGLRCGPTHSVTIQQPTQTCGNRPQFEQLSLSFHRLTVKVEVSAVFQRTVLAISPRMHQRPQFASRPHIDSPEPHNKTACSFTDFVDLLAGLPKLLSLVVKVLLRYCDGNDVVLKTQMRIPWVCYGLCRLSLTLDSPPTLLKGVGDLDWKDSLLHQSTDYTISQIGQLEHFEEWRLESTFKLLALKGGHLNQLSRLKRLGKLDMHPFRVGIKEVEWMMICN
ncbi:hypothetical protein EDD21DRAFT_353434 [Dissophora ornata]|nr:hypothetical protein EDD21DRAFT_353434 [Dissophora ornata]